MLVALSILGAWATIQVLLLLAPLHGPGDLAWAIPGFLLQTWLFTGLFITAHDAMHGTVSPSRPRLNRALGALSAALYAAFRFRELLPAHHAHHDHAGTPGADPDFHDGQRTGFVAWFLTFMRRYLRVRQIIILTLVFQVLHHGLGLPLQNLLLFWVAPSLASTIQLFGFGTYLTHRVPEGGHTNPHNARTVDLPVWLSLLTCYHFGYHEEHHESPGTPWWRLPAARRAKRAAVPTA